MGEEDKNKESIGWKPTWQTDKEIKIKVKVKTKVPAYAMIAYRRSSHP